MKLYRNDLEELLQLMNNYAYAKEITDNRLQYDNLEELEQERGKVLRALTITGRALNTTLTLTISPRLGNKLEVTNQDEAFLRIRDFLRTRQRRGLLLALILFLLLSITGFVYGQLNIKVITARVLFGSCLAAGLSTYAWLVGSWSVIYLNRKHEQQSFWTRNKDEMVRLIISNILSFALGLLAAYLLVKGGLK